MRWICHSGRWGYGPTEDRFRPAYPGDIATDSIALAKHQRNALTHHTDGIDRVYESSGVCFQYRIDRYVFVRKRFGKLCLCGGKEAIGHVR